MDDTVQVQCPYCGELVELYVDPQQRGEMVQDCDDWASELVGTEVIGATARGAVDVIGDAQCRGDGVERRAGGV